MKLGIVSAALPQLSLVELAQWSAANGFENTEELFKRGFLIARDVIKPFIA